MCFHGSVHINGLWIAVVVTSSLKLLNMSVGQKQLGQHKGLMGQRSRTWTNPF